MKTAQQTRDENMRRMAEEITKALREASLSHFHCLYTGWRDSGRKKGSVIASIMNDTGLRFANKPGQPNTYGFKLAYENFNGFVGATGASKFDMLVCDPKGEQPEVITLREFLMRASELGMHCGVPADVEDLYEKSLDEDNITVYVEGMFAPLGEPDVPGEPPKRDFELTNYCYQGAAQMQVLSHPQGHSITSSTFGQQVLRLQAQKKDGEGLDAFYFEAEATGKSVAQIGEETEEESLAAIARGKGAAVKMGHEDWEHCPSIFLQINIPRVQETVTSHAYLQNGLAVAYEAPVVTPLSSLTPMAQMAVPYAMPTENPNTTDYMIEDDDVDLGSFGGMKYKSLCAAGPGSEDEGRAQYRGCSASVDTAASVPTFKKVEAQSCRISRGRFAGDCAGFAMPTMKRDRKLPITITATVVVGMPGEGCPDKESVIDLAQMLDKMRLALSKPQRLMDEATATNGKKTMTNGPVTVQDLAVLASVEAKGFKAPPQNPTPPMPKLPVKRKS